MSTQTNDLKAEIVEFKAGEFLFKEGDLSNFIYVLRKGQVEVYLQSMKSKRIPLSIVNSGEFIGELSALSGKPRSATAMALTEVQAVQISRQNVDAVLKSLPFWVSGLVNCLVERIYDTNEIIRRNQTIDDNLLQHFIAAEAKIKPRV